jgi:hypothetical protein
MRRKARRTPQNPPFQAFCPIRHAHRIGAAQALLIDPDERPWRWALQKTEDTMKKIEIEKQLSDITTEQLAQVAGGSRFNETPFDPGLEQFDIHDLLGEESLMCW